MGVFEVGDAMQGNEHEARLASLRVELQREGLSGFLVPHADEYQNEYLPPCAERLAWLTGFTGSAGTAVVLLDEAAIFVDGRYILQVRSEVDIGAFTPFHIAQCSVHDWLDSVLRPGFRFGYDPWLHSAHEIQLLRTLCEQVGCALVSCESNPLNSIWKDQPSPPITPVVVHAMQYAGRSAREKRESLATILRSKQVDIAVLTAPSSIAWLLNIRGNDVAHTPLPLCFALLGSNASVEMFIDHRKLSHEVLDYVRSEASVHAPDSFSQKLDVLGQQQQRVLCDYGRTASWVIDRLISGGARMVDSDDPCSLPKACKNDVEIHGAREAHSRDGAAVCRFLAWLARESSQGHVTELEAQRYLDARRQEHPLWQDLSFPTISGAGPHAAIVHYRATLETNCVLQAGSLYLVDSGAQYLDGTTDITRTLAIGCPTAEHRDRYTRVLKGHIALATARFPKGTTGVHLDMLARQSLWDIGLDYDHGTGHGVGSYLGVHEGPQRISKSLHSVPLELGMIVSNEPGYYKAGEYGIRIENLIVVAPCQDSAHWEKEFFSFETLTLVPFDVSLVDVSLLTSAEREWINSYHERVRQTITPLVDTDTQRWLRHTTIPI